MNHVPALTREEILAHGFPEGFLDRQRELARVARTRAMGAVLHVVATRLKSVFRLRARAGLDDRSLKTKAA